MFSMVSPDVFPIGWAGKKLATFGNKCFPLRVKRTIYLRKTAHLPCFRLHQPEEWRFSVTERIESVESFYVSSKYLAPSEYIIYSRRYIAFSGNAGRYSDRFGYSLNSTYVTFFYNAESCIRWVGFPILRGLAIGGALRAAFGCWAYLVAK